MAVVHCRSGDDAGSTALRVSPRLKSAYVIDSSGKQVALRPFQPVAPKTYGLQDSYLRVRVGEHSGFLHAKHIFW